MIRLFRSFLHGFCLTLTFVSLSVSAGLTLVGRLDNKHGTTSGVSYSGCWGYVAPDGREYAILTTATGTAIIDITDTSDIREIDHISGPTSLWREVRTYRDRLYVVTEAGGGTQIIDLSQLPDTAFLIKSVIYTSGAKNTSRSHTIEIFDGYMYLNGCATWGTVAQRGAVIFSLADPDNPAFVGEYSPNYFHDSYVRNDTIFGASIYSGGGIYIADITNKAAPVAIGKISYTGSGTHNVWTTTDGAFVISTDEIGSTQKNLKFWDLSTLPTVPTVPASTYAVNPVDIGHNVFVRGNYAYAAWYTAGIAVADISDPTSPFTADTYDTSTLPAGYDGVWAVYPFFWSGKVIAGDMQNGLYVFTFDSLLARTPVSLIEPADSTFLADTLQTLFRWTRAADNNRDPHTYRLVIEGASYDTTIDAGTDTSFLFTDVVSMGMGSFSWYVLTVDEVNAISTQDTFLLTKPFVTVTGPNGSEDLLIGSIRTISWSADADTVEISYSTDSGSSWTAMASVSAIPDTLDWEVPDAPTLNGLLRIRSLADSSVVDLSDGPFVIYAAAVPIEEGWNLLSVPSTPLDPSPAANFPAATSAPYRYDGGYSAAGTLSPGSGYWIKHGAASVGKSVGTLLLDDTIAVLEKWNIVGSLSRPVDVSSVQKEPGTMTVTDFYGYSPISGYYTADTIWPGAGYWVKCSEPGGLIVSADGPSSAPKGRAPDAASPERLNVLEFTSEGKTRTLRFTADAAAAGEALAHGLPPPPPGGDLDVRYQDGTSVRFGVSESPARILVRGGSGEVEIQLKTGTGNSRRYKLTAVTPGNTGRSYLLSAAPVRIEASGGIFLLEAAEAFAPAEYRLHQNHPNPFNPTTVIGYDLPAETRVRLEIYTLIGEKVVTLVDEVQAAGSRSVEFNGAALPSGTYFYRLNAGSFMLVGKMLLAR